MDRGSRTGWAADMGGREDAYLWVLESLKWTQRRPLTMLGCSQRRLCQMVQPLTPMCILCFLAFAFCWQRGKWQSGKGWWKRGTYAGWHHICSAEVRRRVCVEGWIFLTGVGDIYVRQVRCIEKWHHLFSTEVISLIRLCHSSACICFFRSPLSLVMYKSWNKSSDLPPG